MLPITPATPPSAAEGDSSTTFNQHEPLLDRVEYPLIVLDAQRRVHMANTAARREVFGASKLIDLERGRLVPHRLEDAEIIDRALSLAAAGRRSLLTLGEAENQTTIAIMPFQQLGDDDRVLLVFGKRQVHDRLSVQSYARGHGLTPAETAVLSGLCEGRRPGDIAADNGVSLSTVRSQMSSIRTKTGTESVRSLVSAVAPLPPMLPERLLPSLATQGWAALRNIPVRSQQVGQPATRSTQISDKDRQLIRDFYRRT